jgi:hypothetical protein
MIKVNISQSLEYNGKVVRIIHKDSNGNISRAAKFDLTFLPVNLGSYIEPCLVIEDDGEDFFWALAQGLAEAGYFPKVYQDKDNELKATKYHLEDMRKLALKDIK